MRPTGKPEDTERLIKLVELLSAERGEPAPEARDPASLTRAFWALCNIRPPAPPPAGFIELQDAFLQSATQSRGVVEAAELEFHRGIALWQGDITRLAADAIVNAGNAALLGCFAPLHACIDNAIHTAAGVQLRLACEEIMQGRALPTGELRVTEAFNLPSRFVFHTVGPIVEGGQPSEVQKEQLAACYENCLDAAHARGLRTIAFCSISTGVFGYPQRLAAPLAVQTVRRWQQAHAGLKVIFDVFSKEDRVAYEHELFESN